MSTPSSTEFKVEDMSCGHCVGTITKAVQTVDPTAKVDTNLETKAVRIRSAAPPERLRQAIAEAGYTPQG